jgi:hypothetical protein
MMKHRFMAVLALLAVMLTTTSSALAFDCIRDSSSLNGLQQSSKSGMWLAFNMTPGGGGLAQLLDLFGVSVTNTQLTCLQDAYTAAASAQNSTVPNYFALGAGVAGGKTGNGPGVLALNAPDKVLSNGTGIDHLDDTVLPVILNAAPSCGVNLPTG